MSYDVLCVNNSYGHRTILRSRFCRRSESEPYGDRREIVGHPHTLSRNRTEPVRCP